MIGPNSYVGRTDGVSLTTVIALTAFLYFGGAQGQGIPRDWCAKGAGNENQTFFIWADSEYNAYHCSVENAIDL
uniref:Uncharacterized protein n=1 Tax=Romanomermis culicivorax TaxID=13658 RepID=A0A915IHK2_ROMCU